MALKTKKLNEKGILRSDRLFCKIIIESTTVKVGEFDSYTALAKAAEAFSKSILIKKKKKVVDLINKTTGKKFKVSDFSGGIKIGLIRHSSNGSAFKVTFELSEAAKKQEGFIDPVRLTLITKAENVKENNPKKKTDVSEEIFSPDKISRLNNEFDYQGAKYFIE